MAEKGFLSLLFVTSDMSLQKLIADSLPAPSLRERNVGGFKFSNSGAAAQDEFSFNFPDIVFIDESLSDMKGLELVVNLRHEDKNAFLVLMVGSITKPSLDIIIKKGTKGVITKPFAPSSFDRYIQYFFKEKYGKSWKEVEAFHDKGAVKR